MAGRYRTSIAQAIIFKDNGFAYIYQNYGTQKLNSTRQKRV